MKHTLYALIMALCMVVTVVACACGQWAWEKECTWYTAQNTPVYTPGTTDVAVTLPAGTSCRAEETVGHSWQVIEYMIAGQHYTGIVRAGTLTRCAPEGR